MSEKPRWSDKELWTGVPKNASFKPEVWPNSLKPEKEQAVKDLLLKGASVRTIYKETTVARQTVHRIRQLVHREHGTVICGCGQPATHQGWCRVRFAASPARQAFMDKLLDVTKLSEEATARIIVAITEAPNFFTFENLCKLVGVSCAADKRAVMRVLRGLGSVNKCCFEREKLLAPIRENMEPDENEIPLLTMRRFFQSFDEPDETERCLHEKTAGDSQHSEHFLSPLEILLQKEDRESEDAVWDAKAARYYGLEEGSPVRREHQDSQVRYESNRRG